MSIGYLNTTIQENHSQSSPVIVLPSHANSNQSALRRPQPRAIPPAPLQYAVRVSLGSHVASSVRCESYLQPLEDESRRR